MDAIYKNGTKLPASEVTGLMICLLFAGQHTSSVTSTWTGLYILQNKDMLC
jgi:sterol 14-demethylase